MAAVALICMTMTSAILAACGSDEKTEIKSEKVWYRLDGSNLQVATGHEDAFNAFEREMKNAKGIKQVLGYTQMPVPATTFPIPSPFKIKDQ